MPTLPASRSVLEKKEMRFNTNTNQPITNTQREKIEDVKSFIYLGAILTNLGALMNNLPSKNNLYQIITPIWNNNNKIITGRMSIQLDSISNLGLHLILDEGKDFFRGSRLQWRKSHSMK